MYTHGLQASTGAIVAATAAAADQITEFFPGGGMIEELGVLQIVTATGAAPVVSLDLTSNPDLTVRTEKATLTTALLQAANTQIISAAEVGGTVIDAQRKIFPLDVPPGGVVIVRHKTAGAGAGTYRPYLIYRKDDGHKKISGDANLVTSFPKT